MSDRLNAYFDGELTLDRLTAEERAEAALLEAAVTDFRDALTVAAPAGLEQRVMDRIARLEIAPAPTPPVSSNRRWAAALLDAREIRFRVRPIWALGAAAAVATLLLVSPWQVTRAGGPVAEGPVPVAAESRVYVQFRFQAEAAQSVSLAGSFTEWQPEYTLQQSADGVWTVVLPITPGVHDYVFIVDGERWVPDPYAPQVDDGFGGTNSRLTLLAPTTL